MSHLILLWNLYVLLKVEELGIGNGGNWEDIENGST